MRERPLVQGMTPWVFGTHYGPDTQGVKMNVFRLYEGKISKKDGFTLTARGDLDGLVVKDQDEADRVALEHGLLKPYSRNSCKFIQSRAARKRGYQANDFFFKIRVENHQARRAARDAQS